LATVLEQADAVVTYNGDKFDLAKLNGEFIEAGISPVPPLTSIDLYKFVKKLGFQSNKLNFVLEHLKIGKKLAHEGFGLWKKIMGDDVTALQQLVAMDKMERYNKEDVRQTAKLYKRLRPYMTSHPHMHRTGGCPLCGNKKVQSRGERYTRTQIVERLYCPKCPHWYTGRRSKI
jgi:uncharacterized protein YprB with RNaseH-like and TPR domain